MISYSNMGFAMFRIAKHAISLNLKKEQHLIVLINQVLFYADYKQSGFGYTYNIILNSVP